MDLESDNPPLVDPDDALDRAGGRAEVATELFTMLRRSLPATAETLREAHDANDLDRLREAAHRLRGATLYCGVPRMRAQVTEIERLCTAGDVDGVARALPCLLDTVAAVQRCEDPLAATR